MSLEMRLCYIVECMCVCACVCGGGGGGGVAVCQKDATTHSGYSTTIAIILHVSQIANCTCVHTHGQLIWLYVCAHLYHG